MAGSDYPATGCSVQLNRMVVPQIIYITEKFMFEGWVGDDRNRAVLVDGAVVALQSDKTKKEIISLVAKLFL